MMTPTELAHDLAEVLAGLQVAWSIQGGFALGTGLAAWDRLHSNIVGLGWARPEDYEREIRKVFGLPAVTSFGPELGEASPPEKTGKACTAEVRHGPGHQSRTPCELKGQHEVHRAIYGSQRQEATWRGPHVYTGAFDEPPMEES